MFNLVLFGLLFCYNCFAVVKGGTSDIPSEISLTYDTDPTVMIVMWTLPNDGTSPNSIVEFGDSKNNLLNNVTGQRNSYSMNGYTSPYIYTARLTGLVQGNKIYYYRIKAANMDAYSETFTFESHPGIGPLLNSAGKQRPLIFHVIGDLGQTDNSINTLNELYQQQSLISTASGIYIRVYVIFFP